MKITLNLATRPYADLGPAIKQLRIGMGVLAVLLAALGLGLMHFHQAALRMSAEEDKLDQAVAKIRQEQQGYQVQMQQPDNAKVLTQAGFLNQLFDLKSFSWTAAMEDLEPVLPAGVQVTSIEPNRAKDGTLTLRLHVSGPRERAVEMVRNMEKSKRFLSPRIAGENSENNQNQASMQQVAVAGKVSFDLLAEYNPATLEERKSALASKKHPEQEGPALPGAALPRTAAPVAGVRVRPSYQALTPRRGVANPTALPPPRPGIPQRLPMNPGANPQVNQFPPPIRQIRNQPVPQPVPPSVPPGNGGPQ